MEIIPGPVFDAAGQDTLTELLQSRANVQIAATGGAGQPSSVFIRGANSNHTLVLLDGIRINNAAGGTVPFENLRNEQFARAEVVPGPLSSLYGSDALGGAIQLFTHRWPEAPHLRGAVGCGRYDTRTASGGVSAGTQTTGLTVNASYIETDGFSATNATEPFGSFNPDDDSHRNANLSANLVHRFAPDHELALSAYYTDARTEFDSGPSTDDVNDETIGVYSLSSRNRFTPWWQSGLRVGSSRDDISIEGAFPGAVRSRQNQATWQNDFATAIGTLIAGVEFLRQDVDDTSFAAKDRDVYALFGGYSGEVGRHALQASLRNDDYSDFGDQTTGALGYAFNFTPQLRVRAAAGTAFHAPSFSELYFPGIGNQALEPEDGKSWEAGLDLRGRTHRFSATYFENRIDDLIVFEAATSRLQNLNKARIEGIELAYDGMLLGLQLRARMTVQDPVNDITGKRLPRRAEIFGNAAAARSWGRLQVAGEIVGAGERFDSIDEAPASRMDGYAVVNLVLVYALGRDWSIDMRWNNLLDEDYELAKGFNTPGSNAFVAIKYRAQ